MKIRFNKGPALAALALLLGGLASARAQFSVPWFVVAGGGGTASNGVFSTTGTFGQWQAAPQALSNASFAVTGGFWSYLAAPAVVPPPSNSPATIFSDNFPGNSINSSNWIASGNIVFQTNGTMIISNAAQNNSGLLTSVPIPINATGLITITREVTVHPAPSAAGNYPGTNFLGQFGISLSGLDTFSVNYADWDYDDGVTYTAKDGFFLARDGASPILVADQTNITPAIQPVWNTQFAETVTYDPATGLMTYAINGAQLATLAVGVLPVTTSPTMTLSFNAFGLGAGDDQAMQTLAVTQAPENTNPAPAIALSGTLDFGNVTNGAPVTNFLTVSNTGTARLGVSNITFSSAGYTAAFTNAAIAPGSSTNVAIVLTATAATNYYGGTLTVMSDAASGDNTIPVSGFVTSGTLKLAIDISGNGKVAPNDNNKSFKLGAKISLKANPGAGYIFDGWSGSIVTNVNPLVFNISNSMALVAAFVPSPYTGVAGVFEGLFSATNGLAEESSGMIKNLTVTTKGTFSGSLILSGVNHPISGAFVTGGTASVTIKRPAKQGGNLSVILNLSSGATPPVLTGSISGANNGIAFTSYITAYRASKIGAAQYTMLLETSPDLLGDPSLPPGYGYALIAQKTGNLALSGALSDGTVISQSVPVTEINQVPIYDSIYANKGVVAGWLTLTNGTLAGTLDWIKLPAPKPTLYTNGFTNELIAGGELWIKQTPAITMPSGSLQITGGSLSTNLLYDVTVNSKNQILPATGDTNNPANSLKGAINPNTGLLTVTFGTGVGKQTIAGKGAILQSSANGAGYFVTKTNAGSILLQPAE